MQFEQTVLDSLNLARGALEKAAETYEKCKTEPMTFDEGPLFGTLDLVDTALWELNNVKAIHKEPEKANAN